jgi:hypothetical protein
MKKVIILLIFTLLYGQAYALVAFIEDGEVKSGDNFDYVQTFNDAVLNVTGGSINISLSVFGNNTINVTGGYINGLSSNSGSSAVFNIYSGANINNFTVGPFAYASISGGNIQTLNVSSGITNLTGGNIANYLIAYTETNIYGYGFNYNVSAGAYGGGQLTGFWLDDTPFVIDLKNYGGGDEPIYSTYDNLNLVPEPATLALFGLGGLLLRRRRG